MKKNLFELRAKRDVRFEMKLNKGTIYKVYDVKKIRGIAHFLVYDETKTFVYAHRDYLEPID